MGKRGPHPRAWVAVGGSLGYHFSRPNGRSSQSKRRSDLEVKLYGISGEGLKTGREKENSCHWALCYVNHSCWEEKSSFQKWGCGLSPGKASKPQL